MLELAYVAGLIDGEGHIGLRVGKSAHQTAVYREVLLAVGMTDEGIIRELHDQFGGYLHVEERADGHRTMYRWQLTSDRAVEVLRSIQPWLRVKSEQAAIVIAYQLTRIPRSERHLGVPMELQERRSEMHKHLVSLNHGRSI